MKRHDLRARVVRLISEECKAAGEHVALTRGTCTIGTKVKVTILCIMCNRWQQRWTEYRNTTGA